MNNKRTEIAERVSKLYREFGIKSVTMDDVARQLSISKKTLYEHFTDKKDLVTEVMEAMARNRKIDFRIPQKKGVTAIEELFHYYKMQAEIIRDHKPSFIYDLQKYFPELFEKFQRSKRQHILDSVRFNLAKGKKEGLYRQDLNEDVISRINMMRIEGIMNSGTFSFEEVVSPAFLSEVFRYHVYGIVSDKGRKLFEKELNKLNNR